MHKRQRPGREYPAPHSCRGGYTSQTDRGYVLEYSPDHPNYKSQAVPQHRLVMECMIGELLPPGHKYHVHHKNEVKWDNRMENLELVTPLVHMRHHHLKKYTDEEVLSALQGRTTLEAAELLGCNHQTLRNRWDHMLDKRKSPGGRYPQDKLDQARLLALDPEMSTRRAAEILGTTLVTLRKMVAQCGVQWVSAPQGRASHREYKSGGPAQPSWLRGGS